MPNAVVEVAGLPSGGSYTLQLYPYGSDTIANGAGDTLTEATNRKGIFHATVTEGLTGWHTAHAYAGATLKGVGFVEMDDTATIHRVESEPGANAVAGRPVGKAGMVRRLFEWASNMKDRDRVTGEKKLYDTDGTTVLETQVQSTTGVTDQETQGA